MQYQNSGNRIINGDCLAVLPQLQEGSVDFVLTDPPYLVNYRDRQGRRLAGDTGGQWLEPAFAQIYRVLKAGRYCVSFYLLAKGNSGARPSSPLPDVLEWQWVGPTLG
jgi:DNA modification methylase